MKYLKKYNTISDWEDSNILDIPNVSYIILEDEVKYSKSVKAGNKAILYTTSYNQLLYPYSSAAFGANKVSNTYLDGWGVMMFDGPVTAIGERAFYDCYKLTSITIPNSVTSIGYIAFEGCYNLTSVTIGNSVKTIGNRAFCGCSGLTSITIPNSVTIIRESAFASCSSLPSVTIGNSVSLIEDRAFYNCSSLKTITCEAATPPRLGSSNNLTSVTAVYVPAESVEAYKTAANWSYYSSKIQAIQ